MMKENGKKILAKLSLLITTIVWGSSFFILKDTISQVPTFYVLGIRFSIALAVFTICFIKKIIKINLKTFIGGILIGLCLVLAYIAQTFGLERTTPSKNAFLTATYCVLVPLMCLVFYKKKLSLNNWVAAILCLVGIGLISLNGGFKMSLGDVLTLIGSIFFALQIILTTSYIKKGSDPLQLLWAEMVITSVVFFACHFIFEFKTSGVIQLTVDQILRIGYLALICTALAQFFQMFGQKHASSTEVSLILTLEAVFGALFSGIFYHEKFSVQTIIGFIIVFIALVIGEVDFSNFRFKKKKDNDQISN